MGAASLLNLAQDLGQISLRGKIKTWLDAWSFTVHTVGEFLFGWIDFAWISLSRDEHHVLVLAMLLTVSTGKATYLWLRDVVVEQPRVDDPDGDPKPSDRQLLEFFDVVDKTFFDMHAECSDQEKVRLAIIFARDEWNVYKAEVDKFGSIRKAAGAIVAFYLGVPIVLAALLPSHYGLIWSATFVILSTYIAIFVVKGPSVWQELVGIGAIFLVLVALSYSLFSASTA